MSDSLLGAISTAELSEIRARLREPSPAVDDAERIERVRRFDELTAAFAAARAHETAAFAASQRAEMLAAAVREHRPAPRPERVEQSIAGEVGLARRCSPFLARRYVGWATILTTELPNTLTALQDGATTEWRAMLVARETGWLSREHRAVVDRELAGRLEQLGDVGTERAAKQIAYRLDPEGAAERQRNAERDRRVSVRPAPDVMARLSALLPVAQAIAAYQALARHADTLRAAGDPRTRGQIMADTLVQRLTGHTSAGEIPIELQLILPADTLLAKPGDPARGEPAILAGHGPIPAPLARDWLLTTTAPVWLRRLYTRPGSGELVAMDSRRRCFTPAQRHFIALRDQTCRTPWCEAPIRHTDHIQPAEHGGPTEVSNGQGYCATCNHTKQAPGWHTEIVQGPGPHTVDITTPTGQHYQSRAPDPPGTNHTESPLITVLWRHVHTAA